jgi:hypothetical protein
MVTFPTATRKTAFGAGISLILFIALLESFERYGVLFVGNSKNLLFPVVLIYFFISGLLFVVGIRGIAPNELKTKIPLLYVPTNRAGFAFILRIWGRMLVWFLGVAAAGLLMEFVRWSVK